MLQFIRDTAKGWVAWLIIGLLIVPFALWGISEYFQGGSEANVAVINDAEITLNDYQRAYQQQQNRLKQMLGKNANAELLESMLQPQDILENIVERELLEQDAVNSDFRISDQQLAAMIQAIDAFQQDGAFSKATYERVIRNQGYSSGYFENIMRFDALIQQINMGIRATGIVTKKDVDNYIRLKNQQREIEYLTIPASSYEKTVNVSDEDIDKYFNDPETVTVDYVELKATDLRKDVKFTEEDLKNTYNDQKSNFGVAEERSARHILVLIEDKDDEKQVTAALEKANKLLARIKSGESFEAVAKASSEDPGSAASGGDLGYFGRDQMDPAFEAAAYAMKEGEVSDPVKSSFGYHIIKLEKIRAGSIKPFEQVRDEIVVLFQQQKTEQQFYDLSEQMATAAYEQPDSLDAVAEALNLKIQTSGSFTVRGGKGITSNRKVIDAAFSADVLEQGYNSEPIEVGTNHVVVIHKKNHVPQSQKELSAVKADITAILKKQSAGEMAEAAGNKLLSAIEAGTSPADAAKAESLTWQAKQTIMRTESKVDRTIVDAVFKQKKPVDGKAVSDGLKLRNGDYAVVRLLSVSDPDISTLAEPDKLRLKNELTSLYSNAEFNNYLASLKDQASIQYFTENIQ